MSVVKGSFRKHGLEPYKINTYVEYVEFFGWLKSRTVGYIRLEDYDNMVNQLIKTASLEEESQEAEDSEEY